MFALTKHDGQLRRTGALGGLDADGHQKVKNIDRRYSEGDGDRAKGDICKSGLTEERTLQGQSRMELCPVFRGQIENH